MAGIPLLDLGKPLQLPDPVRPQSPDFTPLDKIGDAVGQYRMRGQVQDVLKNATDPKGNLDVEKAGTMLTQNGLMEYGRPFLDLAMRKQALAQTAGAQAEAARHNRATEGIATRALDEKGQLKQVDDLWGGPPSIYRIEPSGKSTLVLGPGVSGGPGGNPPAANPAAAAATAPATAAPAPGSTEPIVPNAVPTVSVTSAPAQAAPPAATANAAPPLTPAENAALPTGDPRKLTGEAYLKAFVPPQSHDMVRKIAAYEMDPRTALSLKGGHRETVLRAVAGFDDTYDMAQYPARAAAVMNFNAKKEATTLRTFNVAIDHLDVLREAGKELENGNIPAFNKIANFIATQTGKAAPTNFNAVKGIVADELVKAILGSGGGALGDREEMKANINAAQSTAQLSGVIDKYTKLMAGQVEGIKKQYEDTTHLKNFESRLSDRTKAALKLIVRPTEGAYPDAPNTPKMSEKQKAQMQANPAATVRMARDAVAAGKDRKAVEAWLTEAGIPTSALDGK